MIKCKCGCGKEFEPKNCRHVFYNNACANRHHQLNIIDHQRKYSPHVKHKEGTKVKFYIDIVEINKKQSDLIEERKKLIADIENTLHPVEYDDSILSSNEKKYPLVYPILSKEWQAINGR